MRMHEVPFITNELISSQYILCTALTDSNNHVQICEIIISS